MENQLSKQLMCIALRNGIELWLENDRIDNLKKILLADKGSKFINLDNETINTADIVGIFEAKTMEDVIKRRNGQWKDKNDKWQDKGSRLCPTCQRVLPYGKICGFCN